MEVTPSGMMTLVRLSQEEKLKLPMETTLSGMEMSIRFLQ